MAEAAATHEVKKMDDSRILSGHIPWTEVPEAAPASLKRSFRNTGHSSRCLSHRQALRVSRNLTVVSVTGSDTNLAAEGSRWSGGRSTRRCFSDKKRPRADNKVTVDPTEDSPITPSLHFRRRKCPSKPINMSSSLEETLTKDLSSSDIYCAIPLLDRSALQDLLEKASSYHPNNAFLYYVDSRYDDKVDVTLRNEAVYNLRFLHNAFFSLQTATFCKAVNLIDRFIVKVKVKPKYIACVAMASYYIAAKWTDSSLENELPTPEALVRIARCGGNAADLLRMEEIIETKLGGDLNGVNAYDFLKLFATAAVVIPPPGVVGASPQTNSASTDDELTEEDSLCDFQSTASESPVDVVPNTEDFHERSLYTLWQALSTRLGIAFCSLDVYRYSPACLALAILLQTGVSGIVRLARLCGIDMEDVCQCSELVEELYDIHYHDPTPSPRRHLIWAVPRRTQFRLGCASPTPLDTISEDCENTAEDEGFLQFLFGT